MDRGGTNEILVINDGNGGGPESVSVLRRSCHSSDSSQAADQTDVFLVEDGDTKTPPANVQNMNTSNSYQSDEILEVSGTQTHRSYADAVKKQDQIGRNSTCIKVVDRRPVGAKFSIIPANKREHKPRACVITDSSETSAHSSLNSATQAAFRRVSSKHRRCSARNRFLFSSMDAKRPLSDLSDPKSFYTIQKSLSRKVSASVFASYLLVDRAVCRGLSVVSPFETRTHVLGAPSHYDSVQDSCGDPSFACSELSSFLSKHSNLSVHISVEGDDILSTVRQIQPATPAERTVNKCPTEQTRAGPHFKTLLERNFHFGLVDPRVYYAKLANTKQPPLVYYEHVAAGDLRMMCRSRSATKIPLSFSVQRAGRLVPITATLYPVLAERRSWDRDLNRGCIYYIYSNNKQIAVHNSQFWSNCRVGNDASDDCVTATHALTVSTSSGRSRMHPDALSESYIQTVVIDRYRATIALTALRIHSSSTSLMSDVDEPTSTHLTDDAICRKTSNRFKHGRCRSTGVRYVSSVSRKRLVDRLMKEIGVLNRQSCSVAASESNTELASALSSNQTRVSNSTCSVISTEPTLTPPSGQTQVSNITCSVVGTEPITTPSSGQTQVSNSTCSVVGSEPVSTPPSGQTQVSNSTCSVVGTEPVTTPSGKQIQVSNSTCSVVGTEPITTSSSGQTQVSNSTCSVVGTEPITTSSSGQTQVSSITCSIFGAEPMTTLSSKQSWVSNITCSVVSTEPVTTLSSGQTQVPNSTCSVVCTEPVTTPPSRKTQVSDSTHATASDTDVFSSSSRIPPADNLCVEEGTGKSQEHCPQCVTDSQSDIDYFDSAFESSDEEMNANSDGRTSNKAENSPSCPDKVSMRSERTTYDSPVNALISADMSQVCDKLHCKLGCICQSLLYDRVISHCGKLKCMLSCVCSDSERSESQSVPVKPRMKLLQCLPRQDLNRSVELSKSERLDTETHVDELTLNCPGRVPKVDLFRVGLDNADPFCVFHELTNCEIFRNKGDCYVAGAKREISQRGRNIAKLQSPKCSRHTPVLKKPYRKLARESYDLDKQGVVVGNFPKSVLKMLLAANLGRLWLKVPVHVDFGEIERIVVLYQQDSSDVIVSVHFGYRSKLGGVWLLNNLATDHDLPWRIADADGAVFYNDSGSVFRNVAHETTDVDVVSEYSVVHFSLPVLNWLVKRGIVCVSPIEQRSLTPFLRTSGPTSGSNLVVSRVDRRTRKLCSVGVVVIGFSPSSPQLNVIGAVEGYVSTAARVMDQFSAWTKSCGVNIDHYITSIETQVSHLRKSESPAGNVISSAQLTKTSPSTKHNQTAKRPSPTRLSLINGTNNSTDYAQNLPHTANCSDRNKTCSPRRKLKVVVSGLDCGRGNSQAIGDAFAGDSLSQSRINCSSNLPDSQQLTQVSPRQLFSETCNNTSHIDTSNESVTQSLSPRKLKKVALDMTAQRGGAFGAEIDGGSCNTASSAPLPLRCDSGLDAANRKRSRTLESDIRSQAIDSDIPSKLSRLDKYQDCETPRNEELDPSSSSTNNQSDGTQSEINTADSAKSRLKRPFLSSVSGKATPVHSSKVSMQFNGVLSEFRRVSIKSMPNVMYIEGVPVFLTSRYVTYVISQIKKVRRAISVKMGGFRLTLIWTSSCPDSFLVGPVSHSASSQAMKKRLAGHSAHSAIQSPTDSLHITSTSEESAAGTVSIDGPRDSGARLHRSGGGVEIIDLDSADESADECVIIGEKASSGCDSHQTGSTEKSLSLPKSSSDLPDHFLAPAPPPFSFPVSLPVHVPQPGCNTANFSTRRTWAESSSLRRRVFREGRQYLVRVLEENGENLTGESVPSLINRANVESLRLQRCMNKLVKRKWRLVGKQNKLIRALNNRIHGFPLESRIERAAEVEENLPFIQVQMAENSVTGEPSMCLTKRQDHGVLQHSSEASVSACENDRVSPTVFTEFLSDDVQLELM